MNAELIFIVERFPELKELIESRFESDEEFQAVCLDYFLCLRSLHNWEMIIKKYGERHKEYEELKRVLEERMLQQLKMGEQPAEDPFKSGAN